MTQEADMTTTAHTGKTVQIRAAGSRAGAPGSRKKPGRRLGVRLWAILHAQALLNGTGQAERYTPR
jgi:hypothetical protein